MLQCQILVRKLIFPLDTFKFYSDWEALIDYRTIASLMASEKVFPSCICVYVSVFCITLFLPKPFDWVSPTKNYTSLAFISIRLYAINIKAQNNSSSAWIWCCSTPAQIEASCDLQVHMWYYGSSSSKSFKIASFRKTRHFVYSFKYRVITIEL